MASIKPVYSEYPFVSGRYLPDVQGRLVAPRVDSCPLGHRLGGACQLFSKGWRVRKTGPYRALQRVRCKCHNRGFTVYPLGMVPYGRRSFLDEPAMVSCLEDAAPDRKWPLLPSLELPTFKTQKRHILMWSNLIGVGDSLSAVDQQTAAKMFGIPTLTLRDGAQNIRAGPTYSGRARIVMGILKDLGRAKLTTLLHRGHKLKLWGEPYIDERDQIPLVHFNTDSACPPNLSSP